MVLIMENEARGTDWVQLPAAAQLFFSSHEKFEGNK
jgi:hypothetical protein